jgi:hypothetical protein
MNQLRWGCIFWATIFLIAGLTDWRHLVLAAVIASAGLTARIYTERGSDGNLNLFRIRFWGGEGFTIERNDPNEK